MKPNSTKVIDLLGMSGEADGVLISGVGSVFRSDTFTLRDELPTFSFETQVTTTGTAAIKVELEQGNTELTDAQEGLAHDDYVVPDGVNEIIASLDDENTHIAPFSPVATAYARVLITGLAGNAATTVTKLKVVSIKM